MAYTDRLLNTVKGAIVLDDDAYASACNPFYCDFTEVRRCCIFTSIQSKQTRIAITGPLIVS